MINDGKVFRQVYVVLQNLSKDNFEKIPDKIIKALYDNMDNEYEWKYDFSKAITEQNISRDAVAVLSYINTNYLLNDEQKDLMNRIHKYNKKIKQKKRIV